MTRLRVKSPTKLPEVIVIQVINAVVKTIGISSNFIRQNDQNLP